MDQSQEILLGHLHVQLAIKYIDNICYYTVLLGTQSAVMFIVVRLE